MGRRVLRIGAAALGPFAAALWIACGSDSPDGPADADADAGEDVARVRDTSVKDTSKRDVDPDADASTTCDPAQPFASVVKLGGMLSTFDDQGYPTLTDDELTMYFERDVFDDAGSSTPKIFVAVRASKSAAFGAPSVVTEIDDGMRNGKPSVTASGDALYFASSPDLTTRRDLRVATRGSTGKLGAPVPVTALNTTTSAETYPAVFARGEELWFTTDLNAISHLRRSVILPSGAFTTPEAIAELETPGGREEGTASTRDGLTVYFGADRTAAPGFDIWIARRQSRSVPFAFVASVTSASTPGSFDVPGWLSVDACRLYLTSNRDSASTDIFVASRSP